MSWTEQLGRARYYVRRRAPYYGNTLLSFSPYPSLKIPTMGITKKLILIFNPCYVEELPTEQCGGVLVHEIHHVARKHHQRADVIIQQYAHIPDIKRIVNIAADLPINVTVLKEGWELPEGGFFPSDFGFPDDLTMEEYFKRLLELGDELQQHPKYQAAAGIGSGKCGSIAGNDLGEVEEEAQGGRSEIEVENIARGQAKEIEQAISAGRGNVPSDLKQAIKAEGKSKMRYDRLLAKYVMESVAVYERGFESYSRRLPSKQSFITGIVRSSLIDGTPEVAVIIDTSGSMGVPQLRACIRETMAVLRACDVEQLWLLEADTRVAREPRRVRTKDLSSIELHGRGGTDFDEALQKIEGLKPKPNVVVYYTDGDGRALYKPKGIDVIWGVVEARWKRTPDAKFGKVVFIPE